MVETVPQATTRLGSASSANPVPASPGSMPTISPSPVPGMCPSGSTPEQRLVQGRLRECRKARVRAAALPRGPHPRVRIGTQGGLYEVHDWETAGVNPAYLRPINFLHSYLCRDSFKDVGWDVEVGVDLLDVVVLLQ